MKVTKRITMLLAVVVAGAAILCAQGMNEQRTTIYSSASDASPKYVFMFIGDGMSAPQTNAAQVFEGTNVSGLVAIEPLAFTQFPVVGLQYTQDSTSFCVKASSLLPRITPTLHTPAFTPSRISTIVSPNFRTENRDGIAKSHMFR